MIKSQNFAYSIIGLILSPLLVFVINIRSFEPKYSKILFIIFGTIFGYFIVVPEGFDGYRHALNVQDHYLNLDFISFIRELGDLMLFKSVEGVNDEQFLHIISYIAGRLGGEIKIFFALVGFVYSFFYFNSISLIYRKLPKNKPLFLILLFIFFVSLKSLEGMNTAGTWVAFWVFFYGIIKYFETKEKQFLLLILMTPLIHHSFFIYSAAFWIYFFIGNRPILYFGILIIAIIINFFSLSLEWLNNALLLSDLSRNKFEVYSLTNEIVNESWNLKKSGTLKNYSLHAYVYNSSFKILTQTLLIIIILKYNYLKKKIANNYINGIIGVAILIWSFGLIFHIIPPVFNRGIIMSGTFSLTSAILLLSNDIKNMQYYRGKLKIPFNLLKISFWSFLPILIFFKISEIGDFLNIKLFFPLISFFMEDTSLKELVNTFV